MDSSKVLIVGSTGYIGSWITKACLVSPTHQTVLLVGPNAHSDVRKFHTLLSYKKSGATLVEASMDDHEALVSVVSGVDYVISAIAENQLEQQLKLVRAIKQVGTIKRFLPSEYGLDPDCMEHDVYPFSVLLAHKRRVRRAIEKAESPTFTWLLIALPVIFYLDSPTSVGFGRRRKRFSYTETATVKVHTLKIVILGRLCTIDSDPEVAFENEDMGRYVVKAMDDPRTLNRTIHARPPANIRSQMEVVNLWEALSGKTLEKDHVSEQQWLQKLKDESLPGRIRFAASVFYHVFFKEDLMSFPVNQENEASSLFPEIQYTDIKSYLTGFLISLDFFERVHSAHP